MTDFQEVPKHKKKKTRSVKKSDHKHLYDLVPNEDFSWYNYRLVCSVCGHVGNEIHKEEELPCNESST